jgi:replicative DNA helicase
MTSVSRDSYSTADPYVGRSAPWSAEAEQAVLGAMLLDQDAALRASELVDDTMFYREEHRRLFRAMRALVERRVVIDHVTLHDELERRNELSAVGGTEYIAELVDAAPTAANLEFHATILRDKAVLRRLIESATQIITEAYDAKTPASDLLDTAESRIFQISQQRREQGFTRIKEMLWPTMERIETLQRSGKQITGVSSGFDKLDEMTSGFQSSELVIVAARPSMGKTAFCLNVATNAALAGNGVAIFSLEMSKESLVQRMLTSEARVDSQRLRRGMLRSRRAPELQDLDRRHPGHHAAGDALQGAAAQGGARRQHVGRGLSPAHAEPGVRRQPRAGDLRHLPLAQGARARAAGAGHRALAALPRV